MKFEKKYFFKNFIKKNSTKYSQEILEKIYLNSNKILIKFFKKDKNKNNIFNNNRGIICGKIQSGKTLNFIGLFNLALDNNCDIVIILTGSDNYLNNQTYSRIKKYFENWNNSINNSDKPEVYLIKTNNIQEKFNENDKKNLDINFKNKKAKLIINTMKNKIHLEKLLNFLNSNNCNFKDRNILIIDDESDLASLDGNVKKREKNYNLKKTLINKKISKEILETLKSFLYIAVTATPYISFLLENKDLLKPKFIEEIEPSKEYFGLKEFLNIKNNCIEIIPENDSKEILKNNYFTASLKNSLSYFIVYSYFYIKKYPNKKTEMIINVSTRIKDHENIKLLIENEFFDKYKKFAFDLNFDNEYLKKNSMFEFENLFKIPLKKLNIIIEEKLILKLIDFFKNRLSRPILINSKSKKNNYELKEDYNDLNYKSFIKIGSNLIQRGITFSNLLVSFFTNCPNKSIFDTLLQRARWLGYRNKYKEFIKIFTTEKIKNNYIKILKMNKEISCILNKNNKTKNIIDDLADLLSLKIKEYNYLFTNERRYLLDEKKSFLFNFKMIQNKNWEKTDLEKIFINKFFKKANEKKFSIQIFHKEYFLKFSEYWKYQKFFKLIFKKINPEKNFDFFEFSKKFKNNNLKFLILFMRNLEQERNLKCFNDKKINHICEIKDLYVGKNIDSNYKGDFNIEQYYDKQTIILQIHKINIICSYKRIIKDNFFYFFYFPNYKS